MRDGEIVEVKGSGAKPYQLKRVGDTYSCRCPAWRNQSEPIDRRTCKHLKKVLGAEAEDQRCGLLMLPALVKAAHQAQKKAKAEQWKPPVMLAWDWDTTVDPTGWWMSEKWDGVRAWFQDGKLTSRAGNVFPAPQFFLDELAANFPAWADGELWMGRGMFRETNALVHTVGRPDDWYKLTFNVIDAGLDHDFETPFEVRAMWCAGLSGHGQRFIIPTKHTRCLGESDLLRELGLVESYGGEGVMLRRPQSTYVPGRGTSLLKVKTFKDEEATVVGYTDGKGRHAGRVGALVLRDQHGVEFECGSGLSDAERGPAKPRKGAVVTFRFFERFPSGKPRHPTYYGIRRDK